MSLPANDAFSFGLVHDSNHHPTLRRSASSTLSSLSSSGSRSSPTANGMTHGVRCSLLDTVSLLMLVLKATTRKTRRHSKKPSVDNTSIASKTRSKRNSTTKTIVTNGDYTGKDVVVKKIDWEIPRKTLHSSIGDCGFCSLKDFLSCVICRFPYNLHLHIQHITYKYRVRVVFSAGGDYSRRCFAAEESSVCEIV